MQTPLPSGLGPLRIEVLEMEDAYLASATSNEMVVYNRPIFGCSVILREEIEPMRMAMIELLDALMCKREIDKDMVDQLYAVNYCIEHFCRVGNNNTATCARIENNYHRLYAVTMKYQIVMIFQTILRVILSNYTFSHVDTDKSFRRLYAFRRMSYISKLIKKVYDACEPPSEPHIRCLYTLVFSRLWYFLHRDPDSFIAAREKYTMRTEILTALFGPSLPRDVLTEALPFSRFRFTKIKAYTNDAPVDMTMFGGMLSGEFVCLSGYMNLGATEAHTMDFANRSMAHDVEELCLLHYGFKYGGQPLKPESLTELTRRRYGNVNETIKSLCAKWRVQFHRNQDSTNACVVDATSAPSRTSTSVSSSSSPTETTSISITSTSTSTSTTITVNTPSTTPPASAPVMIVDDESEAVVECVGIVDQQSVDNFIQCPISLSPILIPVRGTLCQHAKCFDMGQFFGMHHKNIGDAKQRKCPMGCKMNIDMNKLQFDDRVANLIRIRNLEIQRKELVVKGELDEEYEDDFVELAPIDADVSTSIKLLREIYESHKITNTPSTAPTTRPAATPSTLGSMNGIVNRLISTMNSTSAQSNNIPQSPQTPRYTTTTTIMSNNTPFNTIANTINIVNGVDVSNRQHYAINWPFVLTNQKGGKPTHYFKAPDGNYHSFGPKCQHVFDKAHPHRPASFASAQKTSTNRWCHQKYRSSITGNEHSFSHRCSLRLGNQLCELQRLGKLPVVAYPRPPEAQNWTVVYGNTKYGVSTLCLRAPNGTLHTFGPKCRHRVCPTQSTPQLQDPIRDPTTHTLLQRGEYTMDWVNTNQFKNGRPIFKSPMAQLHSFGPKCIHMVALRPRPSCFVGVRYSHNARKNGVRIARYIVPGVGTGTHGFGPKCRCVKLRSIQNTTTSSASTQNTDDPIPRRAEYTRGWPVVSGTRKGRQLFGHDRRTHSFGPRCAHSVLCRRIPPYGCVYTHTVNRVGKKKAMYSWNGVPHGFGPGCTYRVTNPTSSSRFTTIDKPPTSNQTSNVSHTPLLIEIDD